MSAIFHQELLKSLTRSSSQYNTQLVSLLRANNNNFFVFLLFLFGTTSSCSLEQDPTGSFQCGVRCNNGVRALYSSALDKRVAGDRNKAWYCS